MFKKPKFYIITALALLLIVAIVLSVTLIWKSNPFKTSSQIEYYGFSGDKIKLENYLPLTKANALLKDNNGIAISLDGKFIYFDGEYKSIDEVLVSLGDDGHSLYIDGDRFKEVTGIKLGSGLLTPNIASLSLDGMKALVHDEKLIVFLPEELDINVFDNFYTFEMIYLKLTDAPLVDFENAFINLPDSTTNSDNIYNVYTDSDLDLGLATDLYSLQGVNLNSASNKTAPRIIAGEGKYSDNHTIIRVFNEYQAKTAQFLAFPSDVTGGVQVSCTKVADENGEDRIVIATAAYEISKKSANCINIYDEYGILYMRINPKISGPYNILAIENSLFVTSSKLNKACELEYEVYDLSNGGIVLDAGSKILPEGSSGDEVKISQYQFEKENFLIVFDNTSMETYLFNSIEDELQHLDIVVDSKTNGVYQSAFDENGLISTIGWDTVNNANRSFVRVFKDGDSYGTKTDVGIYENTFYWNYSGIVRNVAGCEDLVIEDGSYIRRAAFQHDRTDLTSNAMDGLVSVDKVDIIKNAGYITWTSYHNFESFLSSYNVWEPCFTHRFNCITSTSVLNRYTDKNGDNIYMGYTRYDKLANYFEIDSQFFNATYADGLLLLDKMRIYNLREYLQTFYTYFEQGPEHLVGLEPIHEIEINIGESVGDYNPYNIEGFRSYLLERFGSVENINARFGTNFESRSDIDAPRDGAKGSRGSWDAYEGDYFIQWCLFTRKMVNKRLAESFREALLAGFPAEIISGHSIPEGDAISGFLGQADTRMSPIDAMMTLGCNFGATRYGTWFQDDTNFLINARRAGFKNITMGEYNSLSGGNLETSLKQIRYLWSNGGKYINILNLDEGGSMADLYALKKLSEEDNPRPGSAKGVTSSCAVHVGDRTYQIVELGGTSSDNGLLKSINEDGSWTGDIYLSPFHAAIEVTGFDFKGKKSPKISDLNSGDVVEINFTGSYKGKGDCYLHIDVYEDGILSENYSKVIKISSDSERQYKYTLYNQVALGELQFVYYFEADNQSKISVSDISGAIEREQIARKYFGDYAATEHKGGVSFDVIY